MKKTILTLSLAALIALPLAGCSSQRSGSYPTDAPSPASVGSTAIPEGAAPAAPTDNVNTLPPIGDNGDMNGSDDLAGPDGIVGGNDADAGVGRSRHSALEEIGDGIRDTVDDIGRGAEDVIDDMGRGMRTAADRMGRSAQNIGQDARQSLQ